MVEHLYIEAYLDLWEDDIEKSQWLELLHPFTAVKDLHISQVLTPQIAHALQELVGERVTEVLPALHGLFLGTAKKRLRYDLVESDGDGGDDDDNYNDDDDKPDPSEDSKLVEESIGQFASARQLAGHPITISHYKV
jgi:hypothetical protein